MTSYSHLLPLIQHQEIERLLRDSALLHLPTHFNVDFEEVRENIRNRQETVPEGWGFKRYTKHRQRQSKLAPIAKILLKEFTPLREALEEFEQHAEYLIELKNDDFHASELIKHYERLKSCVCAEFSSPDDCVKVGAGLCWALLGPAIRWCKDSRLTEKDRLRIANHIEEAIREADSFVSTPIVNADSIEYQNTLNQSGKSPGSAGVAVEV